MILISIHLLRGGGETGKFSIYSQHYEKLINQTELKLKTNQNENTDYIFICSFNELQLFWATEFLEENFHYPRS